jgi:hypothetical protein
MRNRSGKASKPGKEERTQSMSEDSELNASKRTMVELWEEHLSYEFESHSTKKP